MLHNGTPLAMASPPGPQSPSPSSSTSAASSSSPSTRADNGIFSRRSMRQLGMFFAGAGFTLVSAMVTRRAIVRKKIAAFPKFFHPSYAPAGPQVNPEGAMIAFEALGLATLNVISVGIMTTGGLSWALNMSSVEELRERSRRSLYGPTGQPAEVSEREMEEFTAMLPMLLSQLGQSQLIQNDKDKDNQAATVNENENQKRD
ncbi:hypothetical protein ACRALDRAFT_1061085 [Sodiomyces alcalophilus JCM 7366]|uniref:uncharacterized protein n=1 Tax=Sodiomyces alcalophilus JCM 7366 TaxID=591952 RepID=UPI0039B6258B